MRAAIGGYFHEFGARADRHFVKAEIQNAIEANPFLDGVEHWSRKRKDARGCLIAPRGSNSNVDEMIGDIASLQGEKERLANEPCEPVWMLPTITANEAFVQIEAVMNRVVLEVLVAQLPDGDFDLLVIDEAPWFNLLLGEPMKLPIEALSQEWWRARQSRATESQKHFAIETLGKIYGAVAGLPAGEIATDVLASANIEPTDVSFTRRSMWKLKADLEARV